MLRKSKFKLARKHVDLSTGDVVKLLRGLKGWTQEALAKAFGIHPAIIMFPEYEADFFAHAA